MKTRDFSTFLLFFWYVYSAQTIPEKSSVRPRQRIQVQNSDGNDTTALNVRNLLHERFRRYFAEGSKTLAGFFDFVNTAVVIDATIEEKTIVNGTAACVSAGNHLRFFIGYPYFCEKLWSMVPQ